MPLLTDGKIYTGFFRERKTLKFLLNLSPIPKPIYNYARKISEITGLPLEEVLRSKPVMNMIRKWSEKVYVQV